MKNNFPGHGKVKNVETGQISQKYVLQPTYLPSP